MIHHDGDSGRYDGPGACGILSIVGFISFDISISVRCATGFPRFTRIPLRERLWVDTGGFIEALGADSKQLEAFPAWQSYVGIHCTLSETCAERTPFHMASSVALVAPGRVEIIERHWCAGEMPSNDRILKNSATIAADCQPFAAHQRLRFRRVPHFAMPTAPSTFVYHRVKLFEAQVQREDIALWLEGSTTTVQ